MRRMSSSCCVDKPAWLAVIVMVAERARLRKAGGLLAETGLIPGILRVFLPAREHGIKIIPAVQYHHYKVAGDESQESAHGGEVPNAGQVKATHQRAQPGKLCRLVENDSGERRRRAEKNRCSIGQLLQRIVRFSD